MPGAGGHFAPAVTFQHPINHGCFDGLSHLIGEGFPDRGGDYQHSVFSFFQPWGEELLLLLEAQPVVASPAPFGFGG